MAILRMMMVIVTVVVMILMAVMVMLMMVVVVMMRRPGPARLMNERLFCFSYWCTVQRSLRSFGVGVGSSTLPFSAF